MKQYNNNLPAPVSCQEKLMQQRIQTLLKSDNQFSEDVITTQRCCLIKALSFYRPLLSKNSNEFFSTLLPKLRTTASLGKNGEHLLIMHDIEQARHWFVSMSPLWTPLEKIVEEYRRLQHADRLPEQISAISLLSISNMGHYIIDVSLARKILCQDQYGYSTKENIHGNHSVICLGDLYFKPNPNRDFISPGMEYAIVNFYQLLAGESVVTAPSIHIKLRQVAINRPRPGESEQTKIAYRSLQQRLQSGESIAEIFNNKAIAENISYHPIYDNRIVQVGYGIEGVLIQSLLEIQVILQDLSKLLGKTITIDLLPDLIDKQFFIRIVRKYYTVERTAANRSLENLLEIYLGIIANQPRTDRFRDQVFLDLNQAPEQRLLLFQQYHQRYGYDSLVWLLGLIKTYPMLMKGRYLEDLLRWPQHFAIFKKILPDTSAELQFQFGLQWLSALDTYNCSVHIIGTLLTRPADAKGDNYIVTWQPIKPPQRNLPVSAWFKLHIISIDNDKALADAVTCSRINSEKNEIRHYAGIKCILYCLPEIMDQTIDSALRDRLLAKSTDEWLLEWLCRLQQREKELMIWKQADIIINADLRELNNEIIIDFPLRICPGELKRIYNQFQNIQAWVQSEPNITHQMLFRKCYPLLADFYSKIRSRYSGAQQILYQIYYDYDQGAFESVLSAELDQPYQDAKTIRTELNAINVHGSAYEYDRSQLLSEAVQEFSLLLPDRGDSLAWLEQVAMAGVKKYTLPHQTIKILLQAIREARVEVVRLLLDSGASVHCINRNGQTPLHLFCRYFVDNDYYSDESALSMASLLMQNSNIEMNIRDLAERAPLSEFVDSMKHNLSRAETILNLLIMCGMQLDLWLQNHETALDCLIRRALRASAGDQNLDKYQQLLASIELLIRSGAGRQLNIQPAKELMARHADHPLLQKAWQQLLQQNSSLSWHIAWDVLTLPSININKPGYQLTGIISGNRWLQEDVAQLLLDRFRNQSEKILLEQFHSLFDEKHIDAFGRHPVWTVQFQNQNMHVKLWPELPAIEYAVGKLYQQCIGYGVPHTELFLWRPLNNSDIIPILFSQTIPGENLQTVLKKPVPLCKEILSKIDPESFAEVFLMNVIIDPEDYKPDNFILEPMKTPQGRIHYRLISVDNDHAFVDAFRVVQGEGGRLDRILQVKTIVFCLDAMTQPLNQQAVKRFCQIPWVDVLTRWLEDLIQYEERVKELTSANQRRLWCERSIMSVIVNILFEPKRIARLYGKVMKMQYLLKKDPLMTGLQLLSRLEPTLGFYYQEAFKVSDHPQGRFIYLVKDLYAIDEIQYHTMTTGINLLTIKKLPVSVWWGESQHYGPQAALCELFTVQIEYKNLKSVKLEVQKGNIKALNKLQLDYSKEKVIHSLAIKQLDQAIQRKLWQYLMDAKCQVAFRNFYVKGDQFRPIATFTDSHMEMILLQSPHLRTLHLAHCSMLTSQWLADLGRLCPSLEILTLKSCENIQQIKKKRWILKDEIIHFASLQTLYIESCKKLTSIGIRATKLIHVSLLSLASLRDLLIQDIEHLDLQQLRIIDCDKILPNELMHIIIRSPSLKEWLIMGCPQIPVKWLSYYITQQHQWHEQHCEALFTQWDCFNSGVLDVSGLNLSAEDIQALGEYIDSKKIVVKKILLKSTLLDVAIISAWLKQQKPIELIVSHFSEKGKPLLQSSLHKQITALDRFADGRLIIINHNGSLDISYLDNLKICYDLPHLKGTLTNVKINDDQYIITKISNKNIYIYDAEIGEVVEQFIFNTQTNCFIIVNNLCLIYAIGNKIYRWEENKEDKSRKNGNYGVELKEDNFDRQSQNIIALVALSNQYFASVSMNPYIKIWNANTKKCENILYGHQLGVLCITSLANDQLISGSIDKTMKVWSLESGNCMATLSGHHHEINIMKLLPNKRYLVSGFVFSKDLPWNLIDREVMLAISLELDVDCKGEIKIWDLVNYTCVYTQDMNNNISQLDISSTGRISLYCSDTVHYLESPLKCYQFAWKDNWRHQFTTLKISSLVMIVWSSQAWCNQEQRQKEWEYLCEFAQMDWAVHVHHIDDQNYQWQWSQLQQQQSEKIYVLLSGLSPSEYVPLLTLRLTQPFYQSDVNDLALIQFKLKQFSCDKYYGDIRDFIDLISHQNLLMHVKISYLDFSKLMLTTQYFHPGGIDSLWTLQGKIISWSRNKSVIEWDGSAPSGEEKFIEDIDRISALIMLRDGSFAIGFFDGTIQIRDRQMVPCEQNVNKAAFDSFSESSSYTTPISGEIDMHLMKKLPLSLAMSGSVDDVNPIYALLELSDRLIASSLKDGIKNGLIDNANPIYTLLELSDRRIVSGSSKGLIKIWNPAMMSCIASFQQNGLVELLAELSRNRLISGSCFFIKIWDLTTHECLFTQVAQGFKPAIVIFNENKIACASSKDIAILELTDYQKIPQTENNQLQETASIKNQNEIPANEITSQQLWLLKGHDDLVQALAVMAQRYLISASNDRTIKIWDVALGYCLTTLTQHSASVKSIAVLSDNCFASGSQDGVLYQWSFAWKQCELSLTNWQAVRKYCQLTEWGDQIRIAWIGGSYVISDKQKIDAQVELEKILTICFPMVTFVWHREALTHAMTIEVMPIHFLKSVIQVLNNLLASRSTISQAPIQSKKTKRLYFWQQESTKQEDSASVTFPFTSSSFSESLK